MEICRTSATATAAPPLTGYTRLPLRLQHSVTVSLSTKSRISGWGTVRLRGLGLRLRVTADGDSSSQLTEDGRDMVHGDKDGVPTFDNDFTLPQLSSDIDDSTQPFLDFLHSLGIQLDSEDSFILLLYGGGSLVALWLLTAIVGAIDTIPVLPKLMEVVGLGYSLWFTSRYLLFKKNRKELTTKIEELKREVLGSDDH